MNKKKYLITALILVWAITIFAMAKSRTKLTYLEYNYANENIETALEISDTTDILEQEFSPSYGILHGIAVLIGTYDRDNNSIWNISLVEKASGKVITSKDYNASLIDDESYHLFKFSKNVKVDKNKTYLIRIAPKRVNEATGIKFFVGASEDLSGISYNNEALDPSLCFVEYGSDPDNWWILYYALLAILVTFLVIRACLVLSQGEKLLEDKLLGSLLTALIVILMMSSFAGARDSFTDEIDNVRGGMIIAKGGVLYRDYVTQHTPVLYYLCGLFALFGAKSVQQFRLSFYLFEAIIWGLLYHRHSDHFGKKKMMLLAALECAIVTSVLGKSLGCIILSDGLQGLCMASLLFEFLRYYKDRELDLLRVIIVSLSIWGSVGAAFISVYGISVVVIAVLVLEIISISKDKPGLKAVISRYYKLFICAIIPPFLGICYFALTHSLKRAYEQAYLFNREVYTQYIAIGDNIFEPYITSFQNFFGIMVDRFIQMVNAETTTAETMQPLVIAIATAVVITMLMKKMYVESIVLFLSMIFSASRGYDMHGMAAWYISVMLIVLYGEELLKVNKLTIPATAIICLFLISLYVRAVGSNILHEQKPISEIDNRIISVTDDNEKILIDAYCNDSIYLLYKNRYPVNRANYMLPWYMDWYEQDTIDDLNINKPRLVVYNPDQETWKMKHYSNAFWNELKKNYTQFSETPDDGWKYLVWIRTAE